MNEVDRWIYLDGPEPELIRLVLDALTGICRSRRRNIRSASRGRSSRSSMRVYRGSLRNKRRRQRHVPAGPRTRRHGGRLLFLS